MTLNGKHIDDKIVTRIQKLLALAYDGGATEAEADLALSMAQAEMLKYNLTMATIESAGGGKSDGRVKSSSDQNLMYTWKRELLQAIAEVNFSHISVIHKRTRAGQHIGGGYEIIGRESNVVAVQNMFDYLLQTIERLLVNEVGTNPQARYTRWSHSFRLGASERLRQRLRKRFDDQMEERARQEREETARARHPGSVTANALVVVMADYAQNEIDLNTDMRFGYVPGTTSANRKKAEMERAERTRKYEAKLAELKAQGIDGDLAYYLAQGFSRERAEQILKPKTKRQQRSEDNANRRYWERERNRQYRQEQKIDWSGHNRGSEQAAKVSLDQQIGEDKRRLK